jgi:hypothetical protein
MIAGLALLAVGAMFPAAAPARNLPAENRLLEEEIKLSKDGKPYIIIDLESGGILLKVKGLALRNFPVESWRLWGGAADLRPLLLSGRKATREPERPELRPDAAPAPGAPPKPEPAPAPPPPPTDPAKPKDPDLEALELRDMPIEYLLDLEDGTRIMVKNAPVGWKEKLGHWWYRAKWWVGAPWQTIRLAMRQEHYRAMSMILKPEDAQALYWAFPEGTPCIIYAP